MNREKGSWSGPSRFRMLGCLLWGTDSPRRGAFMPRKWGRSKNGVKVRDGTLLAAHVDCNPDLLL